MHITLFENGCFSFYLGEREVFSTLGLCCNALELLLSIIKYYLIKYYLHWCCAVSYCFRTFIVNNQVLFNELISTLVLCCMALI